MENLDQAIQQLIALEAQIDKINGLQAKVEAEGMCRGVALEARELMPGFDNNRPLAFYSVAPGYANQVAALESMSQSVIALIATAAIALATVLAAAIKHFFGKKKDPFGDDHSSGSGSYFTFKYTYAGRKYDTFEDANAARREDLEKHAEEMRQKAEEAHRQAKRNAEHQNNAPRYEPLPELDKLFEEEVKKKSEYSALGRALVVEDDFTFDLIQQGPYYQQMKAAAAGVAPRLQKYIVDIEGMISNLTRDFPHVMDGHDMKLSDEISNRLDDMRTRLQHYATDRNELPWVLMQVELSQHRMGKANAHRFKYSELQKKVEAGVAHLPLNDMRKIFEESNELIPELKAKLEKLSQGLNAYQNKQFDEFRQDFQKTCAALVKEIRTRVMTAVHFLKEFDRFGRTLRQIETRMFKLQVEGVRLISEHAKASGTLTPEMKKLEKEMIDGLTIDV